MEVGRAASFPTHKVVLYGRRYSDCSARLRIALNYKGIPYENKRANTETIASAAYGTLNPARTIPTLVIQRNAESQQQDTPIVVADSYAALELLEELYPERYPLLPPLLEPLHAASRVTVRALVSILVSDTQPLTTSRAAKRIYAQFPGPEAEHAAATGNREWDQHWIQRGLQCFENMVKATAGKYSVGDQVTLADVCLVPQVWTAERIGVDVSQYPTVERVYKALMEVEAFQRAH